jgi:hypothetical protein
MCYLLISHLINLHETNLHSAVLISHARIYPTTEFSSLSVIR